MKLLDAAVHAFLAPSNGHTDPLTASMEDQCCTQPGDLYANLQRPGWEDEPIDPPHNWLWLVACFLCGLFAFVVVR